MLALLKNHWQLLVILFATAVGTGFCFSEVYFEPLEFTGDNYAYLELAKNLENGDGYVTCKGADCSPDNRFPPGYSVFIVLMNSLGIVSISALKWSNLMLLIAG